jgi:pyruvate,water dikinase
MVVKRLGQTLRRMVGGGKKPPEGPKFQDLRLKFHEFKYLLRANNEVLTIIAEIETRLDEGGVGLDFIHSRYITASAKVYKMIRHLNRISGDRYKALLPSFDLIRHNIDDVLSSGGATGEGELVLPLLTVERDQWHLVGSKAGNLAQIWRSGHPICDGFVITTDVFRRFMQYTGLGGQLRQAVMLLEDPSYPDLLQMSRQIQDKIRRVPLPPEAEAAIAEAAEEFYDRQGGVTRVSLRSSAIGEDSETSFAGQYTSVLGVEPDDVLAAYREVVASLYSPQAIVYRRKNGMRDEDAEMAVLAQRMLEPTVSGVMYTRDPLLGDKGPLLISAVYGLGLGLVDGSVTPDVFTVSRQGEPRLTNTQLGAKANRVVGGPTGNVRQDVPPELAGRPALDPVQVVELARLGLSLEKEFGRAQDVEWALTAEGSFYILQSRPLQLLAGEPAGRPQDVGLTPLVSGGQTARPGAGAGVAYLVRSEADLAGFPDGAVLVTRHSSPTFAAVLHRAAAVVTDVGGVTGHMASLAREFGIPALVGAAGATKAIAHGQEITVDAGGRRVFPGRVEALLGGQTTLAERVRVERFKPGWYRAAHLITPLTLIDPRSPGFSPERCSTFHDLIRFVHEKSFQEMFLLGDHLGQAATDQSRREIGRAHV